MEGIAAVYFPSFLTRIATLKTTALGFQVWMGPAGMHRHEGNLDHINDGLPEAYNPYIAAREALLTALIEQAQKDF
jgi:hypothetical protein